MRRINQPGSSPAQEKRAEKPAAKPKGFLKAKQGAAPILMHFHQVTPQLVLRHWEHFHVDIQSFQDKEGARGYGQTDTGALAVPSSRAAPGWEMSKETLQKSYPRKKKKAWKQKADLIACGSGDSDASQARAQICIPRSWRLKYLHQASLSCSPKGAVGKGCRRYTRNYRPLSLPKADGFPSPLLLSAPRISPPLPSTAPVSILARPRAACG